MIADRGPDNSLHFRDEQCPKRAPGLSHTQNGSINCESCGAMVAVREDKSPGPFEAAVKHADFVGGKARCAFLLCTSNAELEIGISDQGGKLVILPLCRLCAEDMKVAAERGLDLMVAPEGVLWVDVYST